MDENFKIIKMYFTSPLHVGEVGIGLEESSMILHSDTIFNAICNSMAKLYGTEYVTNFLNAYKTSPMFRISSGFPFVGKNLFFPKPMTQANIEKETLERQGKKLKKILYLPKQLFEKWISAEKISENELENEYIFNKDMLLPKVSLSREDLESNIFFLGSLRFNVDSGLWFIIECEDKIYNEKILPAIRLLQHDGIGGKRSWGYGQFELREEIITLKVPSSSSRLLLSLFYPHDGEKLIFDSERSSWGMLLRGGYAFPYGSEQPLQKPQRLLLTEGSIFENEPQGLLIEDKTNIEYLKNLYHYGIAYSIPIVIAEVSTSEMQT